MVIVGGVASEVGAVATVQVNACAADWSRPSDDRALTENDPAVVGVPEMKPVLAIKERPAGNPEAL